MTVMSINDAWFLSIWEIIRVLCCEAYDKGFLQYSPGGSMPHQFNCSWAQCWVISAGISWQSLRLHSPVGRLALNGSSTRAFPTSPKYIMLYWNERMDEWDLKSDNIRALLYFRSFELAIWRLFQKTSSSNFWDLILERHSALIQLQLKRYEYSTNTSDDSQTLRRTNKRTFENTQRYLHVTSSADEIIVAPM